MKKSFSLNLVGFALAGALIAAGCSGGKDDAESRSTESAPADNPSTVDETIAPEATVEAEVDGIQNAVSEGDPIKGKRVFVKCLVCHSAAEGENKVGPPLYHIVGAPAGRNENFNYSSAMAGSDVIWTEDELAAYLENPAKYLPGNKMLFPGLPSAQDRADVIAYLKSIE